MPLSNKLEIIPGTRLLALPFGWIGKTFQDPLRGDRVWTVVNELRRENDAVRLRVIDQRGFVSFIRQVDFDLLRGTAKPGNFDPWTMKELPEIGDYRNGWEGLTVEEEDLEDDLHIRELELRSQVGWDTVLPSLELSRFLHTTAEKDEEFLELLLWDADPETGLGPDMRLETLGKRWSRIQRERVQWL